MTSKKDTTPGVFGQIGWGLLAMAFLVALAVALLSGGATVMEAKKAAAYAGLIFLIGGSVVLLIDKNALRDSCALEEDKPYSFSRVQLWWWTFIILGCFLGIYAKTGEYWSMNQTCLILLGISTVTTASGRIIDNNQTNDPNVSRHQDNHKTEGLLRDIISDENGMSIHRFQSLVFNVAYGISFVVEVFSDINKKAFPTYDAYVLTLLGVSSGTYLVMKMNESQTTGATTATTTPPVNTTPVTPVNTTTPGASDELVDADPNAGQDTTTDH